MIVSVHYVNSLPVNGIRPLKTSFQSVQHIEEKIHIFQAQYVYAFEIFICSSYLLMI